MHEDRRHRSHWPSRHPARGDSHRAGPRSRRDLALQRRRRDHRRGPRRGAGRRRGDHRRRHRPVAGLRVRERLLQHGGAQPAGARQGREADRADLDHRRGPLHRRLQPSQVRAGARAPGRDGRGEDPARRAVPRVRRRAAQLGHPERHGPRVGDAHPARRRPDGGRGGRRARVGRRARDHRGRRPARGVARRGRPARGRQARRARERRGRQRPLRPGQPALQGRRGAARAGCDPRRADLRGVAREPILASGPSGSASPRSRRSAAACCTSSTARPRRRCGRPSCRAGRSRCSARSRRGRRRTWRSRC